MAKMLDLTVLNEQYFEIKLLDGSVINLKKPSQSLLMKFMGFKQDASELKTEDIIEIVLSILNNNKENKELKTEDIENYDIGILMAIIQGYAEFINEVMGNPNL